MANVKISQLTAGIPPYAGSTLFEISVDGGGGTFNSRKGTLTDIAAAVGLNLGFTKMTTPAVHAEIRGSGAFGSISCYGTTDTSNQAEFGIDTSALSGIGEGYVGMDVPYFNLYVDSWDLAASLTNHSFTIYDDLIGGSVGGGGTLYLGGKNATPNYINFASIKASSTDVTAGAESSALTLGVKRFGVDSPVLTLASNWRVGIGSYSSTILPMDTLSVGGPNPAAATAKCYHVFYSSTDYEAAFMGSWSGGVAQYGTTMAGTGVARDVVFVRGGGEELRLTSTGIRISDQTSPSGGVGANLVFQGKRNDGSLTSYASIKAHAYSTSDFAGQGFLLFNQKIAGYLDQPVAMMAFRNFGIGGWTWMDTPPANLSIGGPSTSNCSARIYSSYTDFSNNEWAYLGDWTANAPAATYGTDKVGTGVAQDVVFVHGGSVRMRFLSGGMNYIGGVAPASGSTGFATLAIGETWATVRSFNMLTSTTNHESCYLGDWMANFNCATFGTIQSGTGVARDVVFVRGGTEQLRLTASGPTTATASPGTNTTQLATTAFVKSAVSSAASQVFYFDLTDSADVATYKRMLLTPSTHAETSASVVCTGTTTDFLIASFITDPGIPGAIEYPAGSAYRRLYGSVSGGSARFRLQVYSRTVGGVETLARDEVSDNFVDTVATLQEWLATPSSAGVLSATDRLVVKVSARRISGPTNVTVTLYSEGTAHASQVQTTIALSGSVPVSASPPLALTSGNLTIDLSGYLPLTGGTLSGNLIQKPSASVTPANNGELMVQSTSNTSLTFKYKGSDGTVRSASLTLA